MMEAIDPEDQIRSFHSKLSEMRQSFEALKKERILLAEKWTQQLRERLVPKALNQLNADLGEFVATRNAELQELLSAIDGELSSGKETTAKLTEARSALLADIHGLSQFHADPANFGAIVVGSEASEHTTARLEHDTHTVLDNIDELRQKRENLMACVEERLTSTVEGLCGQLVQEVEARTARQEEARLQMLQATEQQIVQADYLIKKLGVLTKQLGSWLNNQQFKASKDY
ncbi:uncharacterized protein LOC108667526 [Hyalella azteca]|uniref:Uncharacterized protein LOC108667526 n=1 Tax=Hyalella azteca TaxID=294128 RepID=A0A8B7N9I6_HYAAZ|nr:uncharacterized protein LOC108667526 [Hyalella azteca]